MREETGTLTEPAQAGHARSWRPSNTASQSAQYAAAMSGMNGGGENA